MVYSTPSPRLKFYFAGKIAGSDANHNWNWRESCLDNHMAIACRQDGTWPEIENAVLGLHTYVGPYLMDLYGGGHTTFSESEHGWVEYSDDPTLKRHHAMCRREDVVDYCFSAIDRADVVYAWVSSTDVYGTLIELGYAKAKGKKIWLAEPDELLYADEQEDLWFMRSIADCQTGYGHTPRSALEYFLSHQTPDLRTMPYDDYLKTDHWQAVRRGALERADHRCQLCNSAERLNVHHRTYERRGCEEPNDVTVLCQSCHAKFHNKLIQWRQR